MNNNEDITQLYDIEFFEEAYIQLGVVTYEQRYESKDIYIRKSRLR